MAAFAANASTYGSAGDVTGIWRWIFDTHQLRLAETLEGGDAHELARLLASMFQEEFVWGIAGGHGIRHYQTTLGSRILNLKSLDNLVSLAEAVGVAPVENPGQGQAGLAFEGGVATLVSRIDRALGFRLDFPNVGSPYGLAIDEHLITLDTPEQVYGAMRLDQARVNYLTPRPESAVKIVEIGAGYGGMCYWFLRAHPDIAHYTIVDLPIVNVLQGYFLTQALGADMVSLYGEDPAVVKIFPDSALEDVATPFDVLVNKDSMPEMPQGTMTSYLEWGRAHCDGLFYSYNQEAKAEFLPGCGSQGVVSQEIERIGGFERIRRDHSWVRRGYVEEIYVRSARTADGALRPADRALR